MHGNDENIIVWIKNKLNESKLNFINNFEIVKQQDMSIMTNISHCNLLFNYQMSSESLKGPQIKLINIIELI